jgi:aconitase B
MTEKQLIDWMNKRGWTNTAKHIIKKDYEWIEEQIKLKRSKDEEYIELIRNYLRKEKLKAIDEQGRNN